MKSIVLGNCFIEVIILDEAIFLFFDRSLFFGLFYGGFWNITSKRKLFQIFIYDMSFVDNHAKYETCVVLYGIL